MSNFVGAGGSYSGQPPYPPHGGVPGAYPPGVVPPPQPGYPPQQGAPPGGAPPMKDIPHDAIADPNEDQMASAPPAELMESLPGYSNVGYQGAMLPPPTYQEAVQEPQDRQLIRSNHAVTEEQAREALLQFVAEHCCYGKKPAQMMRINELQSSSALHYTLETFGEGRSTKWTCKPYMGEGLVVTGPPPGPWDIQAQPPQMFQTSKVKVEVPNTASIKPCHRCGARGYKYCYSCMGVGRKMCVFCGGSGRRSYYENGEHRHGHCHSCVGGWSTCFVCSGSGQLVCRTCQGRANLRWFIQLTIKWTNHLDDHIIERTSLPDELIRTVSGQVAFEETSPRVWPVNHFPEQEINAASNTLVSRHGSSFGGERILMQRHRVRVIPVTQVSYSYKDKADSYFVYGFEHKVYAPDYPAKCCCCSVL
ncbi:protein SSUH2 homolog isoform X2 [Physella acuta]|uniref:protein SSUH2 homolog isoform X2 n=1 Tax=Physella acuta TaxID=109671 RepID=UPI0027DC7F1B|nr:protein SSUH2 homolog isoform X2 [Physella acuta]